MISGRDFAAALRRSRFDFFTGVPCSLVEDVIAVLEPGGGAPYVAAVREDAAVGLAAGAWLGGRRPCVLMQNSGLGTSLNALASLSLMYGLPVLLVVTWRGYEGRDAPEHILTGEITPALLDLLGIPHRTLGPASASADIAWAASEMDARMQPVALLVPPKVVETGHAAHGAAASSPALLPGLDTPAERLVPSLSRRAALEVARKQLGDEPLVHANGYICRESYSLGDRPQNFYMIGSMGLASAIGLGLALARPQQRSVVFDGDGNLLMSLGILAMVGAAAPRNFVHCVFDNEVYGSTGNQASPSRFVGLHRMAAAAGYGTAVAATGARAIESAVAAALSSEGPHFVLVKVTPEQADVPRIPFTPPEIRDRFRSAL
ncbi:MAG TPA: thiamine pyrophosphate-dependent enzyme [Candidatus Limnocylindria bacterium]|nr:thiamine pyrophosphate-dependent enzyme [Candidatus Limnocylindria bacterium]